MNINSTLDMWNADAEAFRGDVLDEEKKKRLDKLKRLCAEIVKEDGAISSPVRLLDNHCRHAFVQLHMPQALVFDSKRAMQIMAALFLESDDSVISSLDGEHISFSFAIHDMWEEYHYDYGPGRVTEKYSNKA